MRERKSERERVRERENERKNETKWFGGTGKMVKSYWGNPCQKIKGFFCFALATILLCSQFLKRTWNNGSTIYGEVDVYPHV